MSRLYTLRTSYLTILSVFGTILVSCQSEVPQQLTVSGEKEVNGTTIQYDITGEGHPLVLIHGGFMDRRMWDQQIQPFSSQFEVIRVDLRGFQGSPLPDEPFSYSEDLYALLSTLKTGPVYLLGLSLGAMVATEFVTEHPEMVDALILAGAPLRGLQTEDREGVQPAMVDVIRTFRRGEIDSAVAKTLSLPFFDPAQDNPQIEQRMSTMVHDNFGSWLRSMSLVRWDSVPAVDRIESIRVPTLIIVGDRDVSGIRAASDSLAERIPGARMVVVKGASHHINMEAPEAFNTAVLEFLNRRQ